MVVVAGHWEIGYNTPIIESNYWDFPIKDFGVIDWMMVPVSGIKNHQNQTVNLQEFNTYGEMLDSRPELPRVFIEPRTKHQNPDTIWLHDFTHPTDCIYIMGSAHYNPTLYHKREGDTVVTIKTEHDRGTLWAHQCVTIVLYDRLVKSWQ
jgi:hypothetical protein